MYTRQWQRVFYSSKSAGPSKVLPVDFCDKSVCITRDDALQRQIETLSLMLTQQDERLRQQEILTESLMRRCVQQPRLAWAVEEPTVHSEHPANFHQGTAQPSVSIYIYIHIYTNFRQGTAQPSVCVCVSCDRDS